MADFEIALLPRERLDELRPIWRSLFEHQLSLTPHLRERARGVEEAWEVRRREEEKWLDSEPDTFVLAAARAGAHVGYAFVRVRPVEQFATSWRASTPLAELSILAVLPGERGRGVGSALLDEVEARLVGLGVQDMTISVVTTNVDALRLYERRGAVPFVTEMVQRVAAR